MAGGWRHDESDRAGVGPHMTACTTCGPTRAHIEVGTDTYAVTARELPPEERDETHPKVVAATPGFGDYQAKTSRVLPLFELHKV